MALNDSAVAQTVGRKNSPLAPTSDYIIADLEVRRAARFEVIRDDVLTAGKDSALVRVLAGRPTLIALSPSVDRRYGDVLRRSLSRDRGVNATFHTVTTGEKNKSLDTVSSLLQVARDENLSRDAILVGIGGGVLLDIVGFAASQFRRGIGHVKVGTTLVAQVDAAVGIKCGVNLGAAKNLVGAFHPPEAVVIDAQFLPTVSTRDIRCGFAEMIKLAVVADARLFAMIAADAPLLLNSETRNEPAAQALVDRSVAGMIAELRVNPYESDLRRRVDFGHTISPHLEAATGYSIQHGEAVAVDMALFCVVSHLRGGLSDTELHTILGLLQTLGISPWHELLDDDILVETALDATEAHRGRRLRLPLPEGIGSTYFIDDRTDLPTSLVRVAVRRLRQLCP